MQLEDKLAILADSAKYDVACTSSGVDRAGVHGKLGCSCVFVFQDVQRNA